MNDPSVAVRRLPLVRPVHPANDALAVMAIRRLIGETRPRLVHTHTSKAGLTGRLAAATSPTRPRTIHTFHGHVLAGYFPKPVGRVFIEAERHLAKHSDALIAVSPEVRDALLDLGIGRDDQYRVIPAGLDLCPFLGVTRGAGGLRAAIGVGAGTPVVGVVGRLTAIKDHGTLLRAIGDLPGVHLAVIGDGEERWALERLAHASGIAGRVHFVGWCDDVASALADLDIVALTSRNEGVPISLIEAAAAAKPVVATRVGGTALIVEDAVTGYLVPPGDSARVAERIKALLGNGSERIRMGAAGRRRASRLFGQERLVRDITELYTEVLQDEDRRPRA